MDEFEDIELGDNRNQETYNQDLVRDIEGRLSSMLPPPPPTSKMSSFIGGTTLLGATSYLIGKSMLEKRRDEERIEDEMTAFELERMALYKDMIQVQYNNRASLGSDMFKFTKGKTRNITPYTKERTQIAELTPEDKAKMNVGDYKFVEGGDLFALFENREGKKVIAIRGLMPGTDKKDTAQLPRMILQTVGKFNLDTDIQFKEDFAVVEDYLLSLPDYKDVVVTGHSRGGATALKLARKHTLEAHVFQPVTVMDIEKREGEAGTLSVDGSKLKVNKRHIYKNTEDYTPSNLMSAIDSRESHYLIDFEGTSLPLIQSIDAHQLHHFHKDAIGYVLQEKHKGEFAINRELEIIAKIADIETLNDEMVYGSKEDINYNEEEYEDVKEYIIPTTRELVYFDRPFIPNNKSNVMDANGDGIVSYTEFFNYYKKLGYNTKQIKEMFKTFSN
tara:strand:+ start:242 stop:1579 length:1338 start_codon:yes stop_codon:yes gene_type:complete